MVFVIDGDGKVTSHADADAAGAVAAETPDSHVVAVAEDLANVPMGALVEMYNTAHKDTPIKKFVNQGMANSRVFPLLEQLANGGAPAPAAAPVKAASKSASKSAAKSAGTKTAPAAAKTASAPKLSKFVISKDGSKVLGFTKVADARAVGEKDGGTVVASQDDLLGLSMNVLVSLANAGSGDDAQVKKFPSKEKGAEVVFPILAKIATAGEVPEKEKRERANSFAGKTIHITQVGRDARRRPDTRRTTSWNTLVEKAGKKGTLAYADYVTAGAHPDDLATIVRLGHAEVK